MVGERIEHAAFRRLIPGRRLPRAQPDPHRLAVEIKRLGDARLGPAAGVQCSDLVVPGEPGGPGCRPPLLTAGCWPSFCNRRLRPVDGGRGNGSLGGGPQVPLVTGEQLTQRIAEIAQEMPPIRHLDRIRRALANAVGVGSRPIAGDDLDPGVGLQPRGHGVGLTVTQQVDGPIEAFRPGVVVTDAARRLGVHESLLYRWRRMMTPVDAPAEPGFAAVTILPTPVAEAAGLPVMPPLAPSPPPLPAGVLEASLPCGARLRLEGAVDPTLAAAVVRALAGARAPS